MSPANALKGLWLAVVLLGSAPQSGAQEQQGVAVLAGGCFWCIEHDLEDLPGVTSVVSGYAGGAAKTANYKDVSSGNTGHLEVVEVRFNPQHLSFAELLQVFWRKIDPTDGGGQFCDRGPQYRPAIFALDATQEKIATQSKAALEASGWLPGPVATEILPAAPFYKAEEGHQDYAERNSLRYKYYRFSCGRDARVAKVWAKAPPLTAAE